MSEPGNSAQKDDTGKTPVYRDREWLYRAYIQEEKSTYDIADEVGVSRSTIQYWIKKHDMQHCRSRRNPARLRLQDESWLRTQYCARGRSMSDIADEVGVTRTTVGNWIERHGIPSRGRGRTSIIESYPTLTDEAWLREQYVVNGLTLAEVGDKLGVSQSVVRKALIQHDIPRRSPGCRPDE